MKTFLTITSQNVSFMTKKFDGVIRLRQTVFKLAVKAFEGDSLKVKWSRHLEGINDVLFVETKDPLKLNPINPYKRLIKLPDVSDSKVLHFIFTSFEGDLKTVFEKVVYFSWVEGLEEEFIMIPDTMSRVSDVLLALRATDRSVEKEILKSGRYSPDKEILHVAADESQIVKRGSDDTIDET